MKLTKLLFAAGPPRPFRKALSQPVSTRTAPARPSNHGTEWPTLAVTLAAAVVAVAACGSGGGTGDPVANGGTGPAEIADRYGYDRETTDLTPVYALIPEYNDPRDGYARDLLASRCLAGVFDYQPATPGTGDRYVDERTGQPVFDVTVARQWGYSTPSTQSDTDRSNGGAVTADVSEAMAACGAQADERLGSPPLNLPTQIESAGWDAVTTSAVVADAAAAWRECMSPSGVADLPSTPNEMPPPSLANVVPDADGNLVPGPQTMPSAREIEIATADAQCREDSGWIRAQFDTRVDAELEAIAQAVEEFDAVREQYRRYAKGVDDVIAELG